MKRFMCTVAVAATVVFGSVHAADSDRKAARASEDSTRKSERASEDSARASNRAAEDAGGKSDRADEPAKKSDRASQRAERRAGAKKEPGSTQNELDTCKRDAQGKDGPERARFMTDCLKSR